jgi:hypothetical protein
MLSKKEYKKVGWQNLTQQSHKSEGITSVINLHISGQQNQTKIWLINSNN